MCALREMIVCLFNRATVTLLGVFFVLCGVLDSYAVAGSVSALMTYEKGVSALKDGNCNRSIMYFNKAIGLDPKDKTLRIGMYDFEYTPNSKLSELQGQCPSAINTTVDMSEGNQSKQSTTEPLPLPVPPVTPPGADVQQGVELKIRPPAAGDIQGVFDESLRIDINEQPLTIAKNGSFSSVIVLKPQKMNLLLKANRVREKKTPSVEFPLTSLGLSAETMTKDNLSHATLSVSGNVAYVGIERDEVQVTIDHSALSFGQGIKVESNLPVTFKLRF
ncbi:MAG: hypothetical protein SFH39_08975 [Candidatus Magnetobacterium sp. LHC-1]|uniref:Secreted protein n=1 Tax=Candidatus Magnetobacterium casense TaxID=1455061 RepID=A0ABS6S157_9BACT|nr:hypothetical protein [Candidatus Magnetobacterium casensis]MBF0609044.1 hypothetical protein [Nitrospirota bacterium]MBV6342587.1 hypothetical protein [Candidatus Magnetobacterium casensis]